MSRTPKGETSSANPPTGSGRVRPERLKRILQRAGSKASPQRLVLWLIRAVLGAQGGLAPWCVPGGSPHGSLFGKGVRHRTRVRRQPCAALDDVDGHRQKVRCRSFAPRLHLWPGPRPPGRVAPGHAPFGARRIPLQVGRHSAATIEGARHRPSGAAPLRRQSAMPRGCPTVSIDRIEAGVTPTSMRSLAPGTREARPPGCALARFGSTRGTASRWTGWTSDSAAAPSLIARPSS
jgi:hypothetical protein